jgi:hypothetical protein
MFDFFYRTIQIITDSTQRWTMRSAIVILILFGLWFLNSTFDFVDSFRTNNRLQQLESIGELLKDTTLTDDQVKTLRSERKRILNRETTIDRALVFIDSLPTITQMFRRSIPEKSDSVAVGSGITEQRQKSAVAITKKNYWLNFISSNAFILIVLVAVPFSITHRREDFWINVVAFVVIYSMILFACVLIAYLFDLIPVIGGRPWINYLVNLSIQFFFWSSIGFIVSKISQRSI